MQGAERLAEPKISDQGKNSYEIDGNPVTVAWKAFHPTILPPSPEKQSEPGATLFYLPSWSIVQDATAVTPLGQSFANATHESAYVISPRTDPVLPDYPETLAEASRRLIVGMGSKKIIIAGSSQGGLVAATLTAQLQEKNPEIEIDGLILMSSVGLYDQDPAELRKNLARSVFWNTPIAVGKTRSWKYFSRLTHLMLDGTKEVMKETLRQKGNIHNVSRRVNQEIATNARQSPHLKTIKAPIVLVMGSGDIIANPGEIIGFSEDNNLGLRQHDVRLAEVTQQAKMLKQSLFPESSSVQIVRGEKIEGVHDTTFLRPDVIATAAIRKLDRVRRNTGSLS